MGGLSPFTVMTNIFVTEFHEFSEKNLGKTQLDIIQSIAFDLLKWRIEAFHKTLKLIGFLFHKCFK